MAHDRPPPGRPATRRPTVRRHLRAVPDDGEPATTFRIADPRSPTYRADCVDLIGHARSETRRHLARARFHAEQALAHAHLARKHRRLAGEVRGLADALTEVVQP